MTDDPRAIAEGLSPSLRQAMIPLNFFSNADGEVLLAMELFASREGWPMTKLGAAVSRAILQERQS